MDAQYTKGDHPAWRPEEVVYLAGVVYRKGRHI